MEKISQKETNSYISTKGKTNVRMVMETIYGFGREITVKEIQKDSGLTQKQVLEATRFLSASNMISKTYENQRARHKIPPIRILKVSLTPSQFRKAGRFLHGR